VSLWLIDADQAGGDPSIMSNHIKACVGALCVLLVVLILGGIRYKHTNEGYQTVRLDRWTGSVRTCSEERCVDLPTSMD
jgi:hypothetical protein